MLGQLAFCIQVDILAIPYIFDAYVSACGVCHSDLHVMKGELPFSSPCVVGHEITGEVVEHGAHTDIGVIKRQIYMERDTFLYVYFICRFVL